MKVSLAAFSDVLRMLGDARLTRDERDAAEAAYSAHLRKGTIDIHIASVLAGYAARLQRVNRYGK